MRILAPAPALALALALAACASPQTAQTADAARAERDCFYNEQIHGFGYLDRTHLRVDVDAGRHYAFEITPSALDLNSQFAIAVHSNRPGNVICTGRLTGVRVTGGDPPLTYAVTNIARIPDAPETPAAPPQGS